VAVFPFRPTTRAAAEWSETIPDLLSTGLDGTPGVRVADPWSLWRPLRRERTARAESPDPVEAERFARQVGAERFLLGSIAEIGGRLALTVRLYRVGRSTPEHTIASDGVSDSLAGLVSHVQVAVISRLAPGNANPGSRTDAYGTQSPEALKAFLLAREAIRRGQIDRADSAIDRAIALDSNYSSALIDAAFIKSWSQFVRGVPYSGLVPLVERGLRTLDTANVRQRLRVSAMRASVFTDGVRCIVDNERLIEIDSTDIRAWSQLSHCARSYGWQHGRKASDALRAFERVVRLDSTFMPGLASRAALSFVLDDSDRRRQLERLLRADTTSVLARGALLQLRALLASEAEFTRMLPVIGTASFPDQIAVIRALRSTHAERADRLVTQLSGRVWTGSWVQLRLGQLRARAVDSAYVAGAYASTPPLARAIDLLLIASALAGTTDPLISRAAFDRLNAYQPVDSAAALYGSRPIWHFGWALGAYEAQFGDTSAARRWSVALNQFRDRGGTPARWVDAVQADIEARLVARRGDSTTALAHARNAYEWWSIHSEAELENHPSHLIRLHLALLYRAQGEDRRAEALLESLMPPATWLGFLTTRASIELGEIALRVGDRREASRRFAYALQYLKTRDAEPWRARALAGLAKSRP
jgi:tetratricopeptide (TPR) repeat protein